VNSLDRYVGVVPDLGYGGAQRVTVNLANFLASKNFHSVVLIVLTKAPPANLVLHPNIKVVGLESSRVLTSLGQLRRELIRLKPQFIFSSLAYVSVAVGGVKLSSTLLSDSLLVVREANMPAFSLAPDGLARLIVRWIAFLMSDLVIVSSQQMKRCVSKSPLMYRKKIECLYNSFDFEAIEEQASKVRETATSLSTSRVFRFVVVGRLEQHKRVDRVILACIAAMKSCREIRTELWVIGSGSQRHALEQLVSNHSAGEWITFWGNQKNPWQLMRNCQCLVIASEWEGFPNVVVEALYLGLKVVASETAGCVEEIRNAVEHTERLSVVKRQNALSDHLRACLFSYQNKAFGVEKILKDTYGFSNVGSQFYAILRELKNARC